jgi:hypothetical protein
MPYIRTLANGKCQVIKDVAFFNLLNGRLPSGDTQIDSLFKDFDKAIFDRESSVTREALSNVHGDWYEWLLAISAWNHFVDNENTNLAILMPNISQFDVVRLYKTDLFDLIEDLREKVQSISKVKLITSNPDFVIIDGKLAREKISSSTKIEDFTIETLYQLENYYSNFVHLCDFTQIIGFASVKTSFRPDRRLQIPHEGSLMKALYTHLQTRKWIINPAGLKYYAIATKINNADKEALKTVATHSITTVSSLPQAAVDDVFEINSLNQAHLVFQQILNA